MAGYWIARSHILDPQRYVAYTAGASLAARNAPVKGQILARGGEYQVLEGCEDFERHVLLRFPQFDDATQFYRSADYQAAAALRWNGGGRNELVIVQGVDGANGSLAIP
jgi:uncharacterized protein (DUF1330 family)